MQEIILKIRESMKKQGLSEQKLANLAGLTQNKVHRIISGETQKLDIQSINKLYGALGIVSELEVPYAGAPERMTKNSRVHLACELLNEESDEELEELILKLLQKKKARGGDLPQE